MHHLSDLTQLRHWQETAAISQMKADLAGELVHDAGNLVASAYQQERAIEQIIDNSPSPSNSERPSAPPNGPSRYQLSGHNFAPASPVRSTLLELYKNVRDLGTMLGDTLSAFQYSKKMLLGSSEVRILEVEPLLEKALRYNEALRARNNIRLVAKFGDDSPIMMGEESPLLGAILNLCINACHAMPNGGELRVRTFAENGTVTIEIQDTGVGIAPENLPHIFEPHFTTKEESGGTGMGLPSVKVAIVRIHRGQIEVESEVGKGTTFRLLLPQTRSRSR
jgi:signal transduction histidine kinase